MGREFGKVEREKESYECCDNHVGEEGEARVIAMSATLSSFHRIKGRTYQSNSIRLKVNL